MTAVELVDPQVIKEKLKIQNSCNKNMEEDDNERDDEMVEETKPKSKKKKKEKKHDKKKKLKKEKKHSKKEKAENEDEDKSSDKTEAENTIARNESLSLTTDTQADENNSVENDGERLGESLSKSKRETKISKKRKERDELMARVPKRDEDGISYTKLQLRRMMRRVKRGLDPIPTKEEEIEIMRNRKLHKLEQEQELLGMIYNKPKTNNQKDEMDEDVPEDGQEKPDDDESIDKTEKSIDTKDSETADQESPKKKARKPKIVPADYICQACQNEIKPAHWIYDCPKKVCKPGCNQKKKMKGVDDPDKRKVFVSGLPFDTTNQRVKTYFESKTQGIVMFCKLLTFADTKRCRGNAYITFDTEENAEKALKLDGTQLSQDEGDEQSLFSPSSEDEKKKGKKDDKKEDKHKVLKLGVTKVLNRVETKRHSRGRGGFRKFSTFNKRPQRSS